MRAEKNPNAVLWSQKANSGRSTIVQFAYFLYEFIGARFSIIAFIGLFNVATYNLDWYGYILAGGISVFLYFVISDAFNVFWNGINLKYYITTEGVTFEWGVLKDFVLDIPFEDITRISAIFGNKSKPGAIVFENKEGFKNGDFGLSKEVYFNQLSFENVKDLEKVISILKEVSGCKVEILQRVKPVHWTQSTPESSMYLKFIQLLALIFLYFSTSLTLRLIDNNFLTSIEVQDTVVSQEFIDFGNYLHYNKIKTTNGHEFTLERYCDHSEEVLTFYVSPMFLDVTYFVGNKTDTGEHVRNGYLGFNFIFKFLTVWVMLFSASYIFYKRGKIPIKDLSVFLLFPLFFIFIAFYLFH